MSLILIATIHTEPSRRDEVLEVIMGLCPQVHAESGCELYAPHTSGKDKVVIIEQWADKESLDAHAGGPVLASINEALADLALGETTVQALRAVHAGDTGKGSLQGALAASASQ